jgi:hypothetical protein
MFESLISVYNMHTRWDHAVYLIARRKCNTPAAVQSKNKKSQRGMESATMSEIFRAPIEACDPLLTREERAT